MIILLAKREDVGRILDLLSEVLEIHHKGSHTIGNESPLKINYLSRNRLLYAYRNRSGFIRIFSIVYQLCIAFPIHSLRFLMGGKYDLIKASTKGIVSFFQLKNKKH